MSEAITKYLAGKLRNAVLIALTILITIIIIVTLKQPPKIQQQIYILASSILILLGLITIYIREWIY